MKYHCIAALTVLIAISSPAGAETCSLAQMASLDMTILPDGTFAVPVSVNGTPHKFLVDTAGIYSKISPNSAQALGLRQAHAKTELFTLAGKAQVNAAMVDSFRVGNSEAKYFHLAVADDPNPRSGIDGALAPDFLSLFDVEFDFAAKKMNLFSQDRCPGGVVYWTHQGFGELSFQMPSGPISISNHIKLKTILDGHELSTVVDTGSPFSWLRQEAAVQIFGIDKNSMDAKAANINANGIPVYQKRFGHLKLDAIGAPNPQIDIIGDRYEESFRMEHSEKSRDDAVYGRRLDVEDFTLGNDVLSKLHLYIAYKEHKIYVTAADAH